MSMASLFPHLDGVRPAPQYKTLAEQAKAAECWETDPWAAYEILRVELLTENVWDPCCGTGNLSRAAIMAGYRVHATDLHDWGYFAADEVDCDFLQVQLQQRPFKAGQFSVFMNPPFSKACEFVDHAWTLGARKILCFQRQAWRESDERADWWAARPPARVWVCGSRATCWLFTVPPEDRKGGTSTAHAWYVWERGHKGAEVTNAIYKDGRVY